MKMLQKPMIIVVSAILFSSACILALVDLSGMWDSAKTRVEDGHETHRLFAPDGALDDRLGSSVALSGGIALVGAPLDGDPLSASGAAHLFCETGAKKWTYLGKLGPHQVVAGDEFGRSVALDGSTALIGAPNDRQHGEECGAAYVFQVDGDGMWKQTAKLAASDATAKDHFGHAVALSGNTAVVGTPQCYPSRYGAAYLFQKDGEGNWNEIAKLAPDDVEPYSGFGCAVGVDGQTVVVVSQGNNTRAINGSSAYVFRCGHLGQWQQVAKLAADDASAGFMFGRSVALSGDTLIVGACGDTSRLRLGGAAYVFRCNELGSWRQVAKLIAADSESNDLFGYSVALSGDKAIIGAIGQNDSAGALYAFHADRAGHWKQTAKYSAKDARANDLLGSAVALGGDTVLAGAPQRDATASNSGSAYVFRIGLPY